MNLKQIIKKQIFIIAEIGNNHNGSVKTAKKLIDVAKHAGADAVKFQTFKGTDIVTPQVLSSEYADWKISKYKYWYQFLDSIALPFDKHREVFDYAKRQGIIPFSTPTSIHSVKFLESLNVPFYKIASMDVTNIPLLKAIKKTNKPVIMSTGMSLEKEITQAISILDTQKVILMHCISDYPLKLENANLNTIPWLKDKYKCLVGFSDHSIGHDLVIAAIACGAKIIEKHITLNRKSSKKAEHHFALLPSEFEKLVEKIKLIESALGKKMLFRSNTEIKLAKKAKRSLHINKNLKSGNILRKEDISILRPNNGALPAELNDFIGKKLKKNKSIWNPLKRSDI